MGPFLLPGLLPGLVPGRRRGAHPTGLPLTRRRSRRLRRLVATVFAEHGAAVEVRRDHVVDDQQRRFGLWNLAAVCATEPEDHWPELVRRHVGVLVSPGPSLEDLEPEELEAAARLRLFEAAALPPGWHDTAPRVTEDLVSVVAIDLEDEVLTPSEGVLARHGDPALWRERGRQGLRRLLDEADPAGLHHELVLPEGPDSGFHVVLGESFFTASLALLLPELLARHDAADRGLGVLVAVPHRHQLAYRVVDGPGAATALRYLAGYAEAAYAGAPGPLSPHVHWVRGGRWVRVDGQATPAGVPPEVAEALRI